MTTSDPALITNARSARPSARRYYVWQIAMWVSIVHMALIGVIQAYVIAISPWGKIESFIAGLFSGSSPIHVRLAASMTEWPHVPILVAPALLPLVVIACHRAAKGTRAKVWLLSYWLSAGTTCAILLGAFGVLRYEGFGTRVSFLVDDFHFVNWLASGLIECLSAFMPLPVTMLAALLTIERRKRPLTLEAGA